MNQIGITGDNIKKLREKKGWSQNQLAKILQVESITINRWEKSGSQEASIKSTMYAVLLPILVSEGIELQISEEIRNNREKLFATLATTAAVSSVVAPRAGVPLFGAMIPGIGHLAIAGGLAAIGIKSLLKYTTRKPEEVKIPKEATTALILKELNEVSELYSIQNEAWQKLKESSLIKGIPTIKP